MKKEVLFSIILSLLFLTLMNLNNSFGMNEEITILTQSVPTEERRVEDFSNFELSIDDEQVFSNKENEHIYFQYEGISSDYPLQETYLLTFDDKEIYHFDLTFTFNYTEFDTNDRLTFRVFVGSYYSYDNISIGTPFIDGFSLLCGGGMWDAWDTSTCSYVALGYPGGVKDRVETGSNTGSFMRDLRVHLARNETGMVSEVFDAQTEEFIVHGYWEENIDMVCHFIVLEFYTGHEESNVHALAYDINGLFNVAADNTTSNTNSGLTIVIPGFSFGIGIIVLVIQIYSKKNNKNN